jgi:hypothetical protein
MTTRLLAIVTMTVMGCGGGGATQRPDDPEPVITTSDPNGGEATPVVPDIDGHAEPQPLATPPFTAAQIRSATRVGRTYTFKVEEADQAPTYMRMEFTVVDEDRATIERTMINDLGEDAGAMTGESTWDELVTHASYPAASTEVEEDTIDVPAGSFECFVYIVTEDDGGSVTRVYFAKSLPGAPILHEVEIDGEWASRMTLIEYDPGS